MNTSLSQGNPPLSIVDRWYGLLLPLALVSCILVPVGLKFWLPSVPSGVLAVLMAFGTVLVVATLVLDARHLARRAREPGFNAWDEI